MLDFTGKQRSMQNLWIAMALKCTAMFYMRKNEGYAIILIGWGIV